MKTVKSLVFLALLSLVLAPIAAAQARFQQVHEVKIRPGQAETYEDFIKAVIDASNKAESPITWMTFQAVVGKSSPTYRIVIPFENWGDRDSWQENALVKALGEEEARRVRSRLTPAVESTMVRIWEHLPDGSSNVQPGGEVAEFYSVTIREIRPDRVDQYRAMQRKFKAAYEKAGKPIVTRSVLRYGESINNTFRRAEAFNKWAEHGDANVQQILQNEYGDEWNVMLDSLSDIVVRTERFVSAYRPDLSRTEAAPTTNEP